MSPDPVIDDPQTIAAPPGTTSFTVQAIDGANNVGPLRTAT